MTRVLFLTNCPSPYRVAFFNELSKYVDLTVLFEVESIKNRNDKWKSDEKISYNTVFLKNKKQTEEGAFCPEVKKYIKEFRKDIIIVGGYSTPTGMYAITYMKLHHIPFMLNSDGGMIKQDSFIKKAIKTHFIKSATWWLSTGENCTKYLVHYGAKEERIYNYPFSSIRKQEIRKTSDIEKQEIRKQLGITEKKVILFVGSFIPRKGIDILLEACKDFKDAALVLVGGDAIPDFAKDYEKDCKSHIYIEGFKTSTEIGKYYQAADIFALPTREDIWGLVVNEAMAAGLPIITTDRCGAGLDMIVNGENGYIVPVDDAKSLSDAIGKLLDDEELCRYISSNNIEKIEKYTIEEMAIRHKEIIESITNERS